MASYRVRDGQQLPHEGQVYDAGAVVALARRIAVEIPHLVQEVDDAGQPLTTPRAGWEIALEDVRDHERISILQQEHRQAQATVADLADAAEHASLIARRATAAVDAARAEVARIAAAIAAEDQQLRAPSSKKKATPSPASSTTGPESPSPAAIAPSKKE